MKYRVLVVAEAEDDIFDTYGYVLSADGHDRAAHVLGQLRKTCQSLTNMPRRGHRPPELERIGVRDYLEIHFKPYRVIYQRWPDGLCSLRPGWPPGRARDVGTSFIALIRSSM